MSQHTARKKEWRVVDDYFVMDHVGNQVCECDLAANAIKIVRAVNCHDDLLAALKKLVDDCVASDFNEHWSAYIEAREAFRRAEEGG